MRVLLATLIGGLVALGQALPGLAQVATSPLLRIAVPFVAPGSPAVISLQGDPGAVYSLLLSAQPAEVALGASGTLFLKPGTYVSAGSGALNAGGTASAQILVPSVPGSVFYVQASVRKSGVTRLTNAVPFRVQATPPAGARAPRALAVAAGGGKAYVAHQLDGTLSVVDLVNGVKQADLPIGPAARAIPYRPLDVAIDPDGRHAFVVNAAAATLAVVDVATDSVAGQIPVTRGCRRIAFDFSGGSRRIYLTNEIANAVLVFEETSPGVFAARPGLPLQGVGPGPIARLADGRLVVGHRASRELELVDPGAPPGSSTLARIGLTTQPLDIAVSGSEALVATFVPVPGSNGINLVLRVDLENLQVSGSMLANAGTDYNAIAVNGATLGVVGSGSGTAVLADLPGGALLDQVDLVPGGADPHGTPQALAFDNSAAPAQRAYLVDQFRETVRAVLLSGGPPYAVSAEIPLAWGGAPRVPLSGALTAAEDGDYLMRASKFFNGTAQTPNSVTCQTCHTDGASDNFTRPIGQKQPQPLFNLANTAPYNWQGNNDNLLQFIRGAFVAHNEVGGPISNAADLRMLAFYQAFEPPASIYLMPGGGLSADAQAGKLLFEGPGQCTSCHSAPQFLPPAGQPLTIAAGVGTGLAPINVPSLRGAWATAPYLHDGSAARMVDVFSAKPGDIHSTLTAGFSAVQLRRLVAYLNSL